VSEVNGRDQGSVGLTVRDLVLEVRTSVQAMRDELAAFKPTVVTKAELDLFLEAQRMTRRWSLGIIIAIVGASSTGVGVVLANT
jgi:hypothetical protein